MKIINERPPNFDLLDRAFGISNGGVVFTYGDAIYNPDGADLEDDLIAHEAIHAKQQAEMGADEWWKRCIEDPQFQISQEVPAYHEQYKHFCLSDLSKNARFDFLHNLAVHLSSDTYRSVLRYSQALEAIKTGVVPMLDKLSTPEN